MKSLSLLFALTILILPLAASAATPREELKALTSQLQKTPDDAALREKIIKLAATIKPAPAVPEEARKAMIKGAAYQKAAKSPAGYAKAEASLLTATTLAPWWSDAYYNLSVVQESMQDYSGAQASLRLFLLAAPPSEARDGKDRLYALEVNAELAGEKTAEQAKTLIVPGARIGEIKLGMSESDVIRILGAPSYRNASKTHESLNFDKFDATFPLGGSLCIITTERTGFATKGGVHIGSSMPDVSAELGSPESTSRGGGGRLAWFYPGIHILFLSESEQPPSSVYLISVKSPDCQ